jgi:hypothetical protein
MGLLMDNYLIRVTIGRNVMDILGVNIDSSLIFNFVAKENPLSATS